MIESKHVFTRDGVLCQALYDPASARVRISRASGGGNSLASHFNHHSAEDLNSRAAAIAYADANHERSAPDTAGVRTFVILPTSNCNMGCDYCGQAHQAGNIHGDIHDAVEQRVLAGIQAAAGGSVQVSWFGGEPLLAYRKVQSLSASFVVAARQYSVQYSAMMATNGYLLTQQRLRHLVDECYLTRIDITIDGLEARHNEHRPLKRREHGSYSRIIALLQWYAEEHFENDCTIVIRTNVDRRNRDEILEYLRDMKNRGLDSHDKFLYDVSPIHSWSNDVSDIMIPIHEAAQLETSWFIEMERLGLPYVLLPSEVLGATCTATDPLCEVIAPSGEIHSCTETPLTPTGSKDVVGSITDLPFPSLRPDGQFSSWDGMVRSGSVPCSSCELQPVCRGNCPKQWHEGNIPCPTLKLNIDDRIAIFMARHGYSVVTQANPVL